MQRSHVGTATVLSFIVMSTPIVMVTPLPHAALPHTIAGMRQPSIAGVLEAVVGHWKLVLSSALRELTWDQGAFIHVLWDEERIGERNPAVIDCDQASPERVLLCGSFLNSFYVTI